MAEKIVIRIQTARTPPQAEEPTVPQVTVYYWHRIVPAVVVLIAVVIAAVIGIRQVLNRHDVEAARSVAPPVADVGVSPPHQAAPSESLSPTSRPTPARDVQSAVPPLLSATTSTPEISGTRATMKSTGIRRYQLTSAVLDGEPTDRVDNRITMNDKGLVKIFLFMETAGLKGSVLFHDWYWKDRLIAHARVPITHDHQNSATSKFIDRIMTGSWHVQIVDERKRILAEAAFEVR